MPTTLQDAVIRVKLDPGRAVQDVKDRERAEERIGQARARARAKEIEREWGRVENESMNRVRTGAHKVATVARAVSGGPSAMAAGAGGMVARVAAFASPILGAAGSIAAGLVAGAIAFEFMTTSALPPLGATLAEAARGVPWAEGFANAVNKQIQDLADNMSVLSAKVTQFAPAVGQTVEMATAQIRLGGEIPTVYANDDTFKAIYKMKQAEKQFSKSIDRDRNSHMARMLARAMKGGQG